MHLPSPCGAVACLSLLLFPRHHRHSPIPRKFGIILGTRTTVVTEDDDDAAGGRFGSRAYWNDRYTNSSKASTSGFSWYSGWDELEPFVRELIPDTDTSILLPGVGNDPLLRDLYIQGGYPHLAAFDYAPAGVACARALLKETNTVPIVIADARDLSGVYTDNQFGAVIEKGTLDAIYLSGGMDKRLGSENLDCAVRELARVTSGLLISITAACTDAVQESLHSILLGGETGQWEEIRNGEFYSTEDGYTSNNIDGTLFAWRRK